MSTEELGTATDRAPIPTASPRWLHFLHGVSPSYVLENKGATARDHLANERTYLAYLRTSLSLLTVGVALSQLYRLSNSSTTSESLVVTGKALGATFIVLAILFIAFAVVRYFYAQALMVRGLFPASKGTVAISSAVLIFVTVAVLVATLIAT